jgi:transcriptional regulator with XRE-family HTH domain
MPKKVVSKWARDTRESLVAFLAVKVAEESQRRGLSFSDAQKKIGHAAGGLSLSTMQRIMSGDTGPSIDTLSDLAHTLGCTVAEMLTSGVILPQISSSEPPAVHKRLPESARLHRR